MNKTLTGAVLALACFSAHAAFMDGSDLANLIQATERIQARTHANRDFTDSARGQGYVQGVFDAMLSLKYLCGASSVTTGQATAIVSKFLRDNPEKWGWSADQLVGVALVEAFPCYKKP